MVDAVQGRDLPTIQGITVVFVLCQVAMSLIVDLLYAAVNPRLRTS